MVDVVGLGGVDVPVEDGQQSERVRLSVGGIGKADIGVGRGVMAIGHERRTAEPLPRLKPHSHREPVANEPNSARAGEYDELVRASGWRSGLTASTPATQALTKIASTTASPAQRSARSDRSAKAAPTGMVVAASPKLWIRSASSRDAVGGDKQDELGDGSQSEDREGQPHGAQPLARAHDRAIDETLLVPVIVGAPPRLYRPRATPAPREVPVRPWMRMIVNETAVTMEAWAMASDDSP